MWLKQKVFTFELESEAKIQNDNFEEIKVSLNRKLTTISLEQLFTKISYYSFSEDGKTFEVKGWSILQILNEGRALIGEKNIEFSFQDAEGNEFILISIVNPWLILNDIEISEKDLNDVNEKLIELSEASAKENNTDAEGSPHTKEVSVFVNDSYNLAKKSFINRGFKEYSKDNFRLLILEKNESFQANLIEIISAEKIIQHYNPIKVLDNFYQFNDKRNDEVIDVKLIGEELEINYSNNAAVELAEEFEEKLDNDLE